MASVGDVIVKNPNILHGTPVFRGTRSPFRLSWTTSKQETLWTDSSRIFPRSAAKTPLPRLRTPRPHLSASVDEDPSLTNVFPSVCEITCPVMSANPLDTLVSEDSRTAIS